MSSTAYPGGVTHCFASVTRSVFGLYCPDSGPLGLPGPVGFYSKMSTGPPKTSTTSQVAQTITTKTISDSIEPTQTPTTASSDSDHELTQPGLAKNCDKFH